MAIWDGSTFNTDALASATNRWMELNFTPIVVKRNALLYSMLGLDGASGNKEVPNWNNVLKKDYEVRGNNLVVRLLGELETINVLAAANQTDAATWNNNPNALGAAEFAWTSFWHNEAVTDRDFKLIRGNEAKTASYMEDVMQRLRLSWQDTIGTAINSTNAQSASALGGWEYAVDATGTYGTLTRAGDNPNWSGNETDVGGAGDLDDLDAMKADILQDGGNPSVGVAAKVPFNKIKQEMRGYACAPPESWKFYEGGGLVHYDGTTFAFEHRCTATVVGMFTPDALRFYMDDQGVAIDVLPKEVMKATLKGCSLGFAIRAFAAFVVKHPGACGKLTNWTS